MAGPRNLVSSPTFNDRNFGLLTVVQPRYDEPDAHWRNGITFQDICGQAGTTFDPFCVTGTGAPPKAANVTQQTFGATPFTVFGEVNCSPVGYSQDEARSRATDSLTRNEGFQVERAFWTGQAGGVSSAVYSVQPHLAANAAATDSVGIQLQCAATPVSGSVVFDVVEGIGRLESAMANCYSGQSVLHVPTVLGERFLADWGAEIQGSQMRTRIGNLIALGAGYPGTGPDGTSIPNAAWIYITPPVIAYRSAPETFAFKEELNRTNNTVQAIVERTYVLGFACCCFFALPISLGGVVSGQPLSAF